MPRSLLYILCLLIALQSSFVSLVQSAQLASLKTSVPDDVELICTGSTMKWVSISQSEAAGKLVFVELNTSDKDDLLLEMACPGSKYADNPSQLSLAASIANLEIATSSSYQLALYQRPYTAFAYVTAQPRSPPTKTA